MKRAIVRRFAENASSRIGFSRSDTLPATRAVVPRHRAVRQFAIVIKIPALKMRSAVSSEEYSDFAGTIGARTARLG